MCSPIVILALKEFIINFAKIARTVVRDVFSEDIFGLIHVYTVNICNYCRNIGIVVKNIQKITNLIDSIDLYFQKTKGYKD